MPSNLLAQPRFWEKKEVALKLEVTYNTDAAPTGAANWYEARNVSLKSIDAETADRNLIKAYFGNGGSLVTAKWASLSFDIGLAGSGMAGTAPKWGSSLLACAMSETISVGVSATYNLVSSAIKSVSAYLEIDGVLYKFIGARGNAKFKLAAKGIPTLSLEFQSPFLAPVTGSISGIDKTGWQIEDPVNSVNTGKVTLNAVDLAFSNLEFNLGNQIKRISLPGPQVGVEITDRKPSASMTVLAPALAVFDPYALVDAGTIVALTNTHGLTAGKKIKPDLNVRLIGVDEGDVDGMLAYTLNLEPLPVSGNDEITLTVM